MVPWTAALLLLANVTLASPHPTTTATHRPAPSFTLPSLAPDVRHGRDGTVSLDSLRGQVVVIDFWASWCGPCARSFPWLESVHQRFASRGAKVVAIDLDKRREDAEAFLDRHPATFTVAFDPSGTTAEAFRVSAMPTTFVVDRDGEILYAHAGFTARDTGAVVARVQEACSR